MDERIAVIPENPLMAALLRLFWQVECLSFGRCIHPM